MKKIFLLFALSCLYMVSAAQSVINYDYHKPLLLDHNGGDGSNLLYHSLLTSYTPGLHCGLAIVPDSVTGKKITCKNLSIYHLFTLAWSDSGKNFNQLNTRYRVKDTTRIVNSKAYGQAYRDWLAQGNGFCYELLVPPDLAGSALKMMREDLRRYFPRYRGSIVKQKQRCLVLGRTKPAIDLNTLGGKPDIQLDRFNWAITNCTLEVFVERLNYFSLFRLPVVDESHIEQNIDLNVSLSSAINGAPDVGSINDKLAPFGLKLTEEERTFEQLIISDQAR